MTDFLNDITLCLEVLHKGGIILYPTDTIWGIGCDATNAKAVAKIYHLKKRTEEKSMIILLAEKEDIVHYVTTPDPSIFDYVKNFLKPVTVIYDGAKGLAENVINKDGTAAIRVTQDVFCKQLIKKLEKPIVSSSANISGTAPPSVFSEISMEIKNGVDYIVQHRQNDLTPAVPSSIIKWDENSSVKIIRP